MELGQLLKADGRLAGLSDLASYTPFLTRSHREGELNEPTGLIIQRPGPMTGIAQSLVTPPDLGVLLAELF
jgi:hypothetical protein